MAKIPSSFITDLLNRVDIIDVIQRRVTLQKKGNNYIACCPFHNEKTPSFSVSEPKQFFHCFGCGEHGSAIGFLMKHDNLSFIEAVEELAEMAGVEVPSTRAPQMPTEINYYELLAECNRFFIHQFNQTDAVIEYALQRGLNDEVLAKFQVGFAPNQWDGLTQAVAKTHIKSQALSTLGMIIQREGKSSHYDRFRNRLLFPIHSRRGHIIGFAGRVINPEDNPKYLNSPESPIFHKNNELYGFYQLLQIDKKPDWILVTEGYLDVIALAQYGITNAVASMGTALSVNHLTQLFRVTDKVVLAFDGDAAGVKAADRAYQHLLPLLRDNHYIEILLFPQGSDPDQFVRAHGKEGMLELAEHAMGCSDYLVNMIQRHADPDKLDNHPSIINLVKPLIRSMTDESAWRNTLTQAVERLLGQTLASLRKPSSNTSPSKTPSPPVQVAEKQNASVRELIKRLISYPEIGIELANSSEYHQILKQPDPSTIAGWDIVTQILTLCARVPAMTSATLLESMRDHPHIDILHQLALNPPPLDDPRALSPEAKGHLKHILKQLQTNEWTHLQNIVSQFGLAQLNADQQQRYKQLSQSSLL